MPQDVSYPYEFALPNWLQFCQNKTLEKKLEFCHFMHLCHARHYSQEDMCIIGKERKKRN